MTKRAPLTDADDQVRQSTAEDGALLRPAKKVSPSAHLIGVRGPQKAPTKVPTSIRLSPEVVDFFRRTGSGWQSRLDGVLKQYVARQSG
jgi:uncharacterized protein (DUF4415 family)